MSLPWCGDPQHLLVGAKLSMARGMCFAHNSPRNGDTAETHHLWKQAESFALRFISLEPKHRTTWIDIQLLSSNGFPSRGPAGIAAIGPGGERSLLLKDSHREGNSYLKRFM